MHTQANTAAASTCVGKYQCATNFPGPTGLGASFNRALWAAKGEVTAPSTYPHPPQRQHSPLRLLSWRAMPPPRPALTTAHCSRSSPLRRAKVISTELRAISNANGVRGIGGLPQYRRVGTSAFGPNLNIIRDPRYGRNSELPGEDPMLTGVIPDPRSRVTYDLMSASDLI